MRQCLLLQVPISGNQVGIVITVGLECTESGSSDSLECNLRQPKAEQSSSLGRCR